MVFVCACVKLFFFTKGGGGFNISRPRGPWFLDPSMHLVTMDTNS